MRWTMMGCLLAAALVAVGCETREIGQKEAASTPDARELVFSDDFNREQLGSNWRRGAGENGSGKWKIRNGMVHGSAIRNDPLWLTKPLPEKVRIEFDAKATTPEGDLKVEIFGDGNKHESGYILIFGGWDNRLDVIARLDEHGQDRKERPSKKVQAGKTYRMAVERTDGSVRWYVDGQLFMTYDDPNPLRGPDHRYFAFNDWEAPVVFDNVKVYRLK